MAAKVPKLVEHFNKHIHQRKGESVDNSPPSSSSALGSSSAVSGISSSPTSTAKKPDKNSTRRKGKHSETESTQPSVQNNSPPTKNMAKVIESGAEGLGLGSRIGVEAGGATIASSPPTVSSVMGNGLGGTGSATATEIAVAAINGGRNHSNSHLPSTRASASASSTSTPMAHNTISHVLEGSSLAPPSVNGTDTLDDIVEGDKSDSSDLLSRLSGLEIIDDVTEESEESEESEVLEEGEILESKNSVGESKELGEVSKSTGVEAKQNGISNGGATETSVVSSSSASSGSPVVPTSKGTKTLSSSSAKSPSIGNTTTSDSPLTKIVEVLPSLPKAHQELITKNIERVGAYPRELPLSVPWTLYFSDTSGAQKQGHGVSREQYSQAQTPLFTATTVSNLCGSLKAYKNMVRPKRNRPGQGEQDSMGLNQAGHNLHFFRAGVEPSWEDKWNALGGRIIISPPPHQFDLCFERLLLLLAGSALEARAADLLGTPTAPGGPPRREPAAGVPTEGLILGVVASRRARGDRIEIWLGGRGKKETPNEWISRFVEALTVELDLPDLSIGKYKRHFSGSS